MFQYFTHSYLVIVLSAHQIGRALFLPYKFSGIYSPPLYCTRAIVNRGVFFYPIFQCSF